MKSLALLTDLNNLEEKNKLIDYCKYENLEIDIFYQNNNFSEIKLLINSEQISKIIISSPKSLDDDLLGFCKKMISLIDLKILIFCASYDFPDPFQNAIRTLPYFGNSPQRMSRIKESINKKASRGQVLGKIPFGYKKNSSSLFIVEQNQADVIKKIFNIFLENKSINKTVNELNEVSSKKWSYQSVKHVLQNDFYIGNYRRYNILIPNSHEPIVNNSIFTAVSDEINNRVSRKYKKNSWNKILYCKLCDSKLVTTSHKNYWYSNGERKSKSYKYYSCKNINSKDSNCKSLSISYEKLNSLLEQKFSGHNFFDQKYSDKYLYKIVSELTSGKIDFSEFKSEFQKLVFYLDNSQKVIKKIFVNKDSKEIILSSS